MRWQICAGAALLSLLGAVTRASAEDAAQPCPALDYATGVSMIPAKPNVMLVPVTINGVTKMMMLDTGGVASALTRDTLNELNLSEHGSPKRLFDMEGNISRTRTFVQALTLGSLDFKNMALQVNNAPTAARTDMSSTGTSRFAGKLFTDLLAGFDLDLDFGANRLNLFSPLHCVGAGVYWPTRPVAVVPFILTDSHITLPVMLDGHAMSAIVDTGAPYTTLSLGAAERLFHLSPRVDLTTVSTHIPGNQSLAIYSHRFSVMTFEGVTITHPSVLVVRAGTNPDAPNGSPLFAPPRKAMLPDLIIGMDILRALHIYIAYQESRLYITRSEATDADLLPPLTVAPLAAAQ